MSLLPPSTNFLAGWSRSNLSGSAHTDALCHSITQSVLLVSRHVKGVTEKVNLTLNGTAAFEEKKGKLKFRGFFFQYLMYTHYEIAVFSLFHNSMNITQGN